MVDRGARPILRVARPASIPRVAGAGVLALVAALGIACAGTRRERSDPSKHGGAGARLARTVEARPRPVPPIMSRVDGAITDPSADAITAIRIALSTANGEGFVPLPDFGALPDGARVRRDSERWTSRFLQPSATPYAPSARAQRSAHAATNTAPDLLRHRYFFVATDERRFEVAVTESAEWLHVEVVNPTVDIEPQSVSDRAHAISQIAHAVLALDGEHLGKSLEQEPHHWTFDYGSLDDGARFSSAPSRDLRTMWSWADRVDGGLDGGHVHFIGHKKIEPTSGRLVFLDTHHWFDGRCWEPFQGR